MRVDNEFTRGHIAQYHRHVMRHKYKIPKPEPELAKFNELKRRALAKKEELDVDDWDRDLGWYE